MKKHWIEVCFKDVVDKVSTVKYKLKQKEYSEIGSFPVVDQGKDLIGGYTDKEELVLKCSLPVIVFGDHTKAVKLINFKFVPGADGTKVLLPKSIVVPSFLSFYTKILTQKIEDKGYARHYQQIENQVIFLPPLPEQRAIVARIEELFSELDHAIANLKSAQAKLEIYRQAVLKKAFEGGFDRNVKWSYVPINKLSEVVRGGSPRPAGNPKFYDGDIPFLKVADLTRSIGPYLNTFTYSIKEAGLKKTRLVKPNTLLLSNSGATLGVPRICTFETTFNDGIAAFLGLNKEELLYHFYFWTSKTQELRNIDQGAAQPNLNTGLIGSIEIPVGPLGEMKKVVQEIESRLSVADKLAETIQTNLLKSESLRQSILKQAFEGKLLTETELEACRKEADWEPAEKLLERIKGEKKIVNSKKI